jgi:hypothetical protein
MKDEDGFDDEFEEEGYPTEGALRKIENWDANDPIGLAEYIKDYVNRHGRAWWEGEFFKMATGGWSGCESIIAAIDGNFAIAAMYWESSHRGGLHVYRFGKKDG